MAGINKVILVGNLGSDPEVKTLENGIKVARFSLATSETYKDRNTSERVTQTEWHNIVLWRSLAEIAEKYITKGSQVYIEGKLQTRSYQDKEGVTKYSTQVIAQNLTMLGSSNRQNDQNESPIPNTISGKDDIEGNEMDDLPF